MPIYHCHSQSALYGTANGVPSYQKQCSKPLIRPYGFDFTKDLPDSWKFTYTLCVDYCQLPFLTVRTFILPQVWSYLNEMAKLQTLAQLHSIHFTNFKEQMAKPKPVCWQIIHAYLDKKQITQLIGKSQKNTRYELFASMKKNILAFITTSRQNVTIVIYFLLASMRTQGNSTLY